MFSASYGIIARFINSSASTMATNLKLIDPENKITHFLELLKTGDQVAILQRAREMALRQEESPFFIEALKIYLHPLFQCDNKQAFERTIAIPRDEVDQILKQFHAARMAHVTRVENDVATTEYEIILRADALTLHFDIGYFKNDNFNERVALTVNQLQPVNNPFLVFLLLMLKAHHQKLTIAEIKYFQ